MKTTILVTGGAGYVGSHVAVALMEAGHDVVILDGPPGAEADPISRINQIGVGVAQFVEGDPGDAVLLARVFGETPIDAVVHLRGARSVTAPATPPPPSDAADVDAAAALIAAARAHGSGRLVFSASAAVYGVPETVPVPETAPLDPTTREARLTLAVERMLEAAAGAGDDFAALSLRHFDPVGAHPSGMVGEAAGGATGRLFDAVAHAASGLDDRIRVFGDDHPTRDGTCIRDYVHVVDIAEGHVAALAWLLGEAGAAGSFRAVNLGSGRGATVYEALAAFRRAVGRELPFHVVDRRPGDAPELALDPALAERLFGWRARRSLEEMCADHWAFHRRALERRC